jgi:hypothetical protein
MVIVRKSDILLTSPAPQHAQKYHAYDMTVIHVLE